MHWAAKQPSRILSMLSPSKGFVREGRRPIVGVPSGVSIVNDVVVHRRTSEKNVKICSGYQMDTALSLSTIVGANHHRIDPSKCAAHAGNCHPKYAEN